MLSPILTSYYLYDNQGGMMKLHKQPMNVKDYIQDVVSSIAAEAREKGITIDFKRGFSNNNETSGNDDVSIANVSLGKGSLLTSRQVVASNRLYGMVMGADRSMKSVRRSFGSMISIKKISGNKCVFENVSRVLFHHLIVPRLMYGPL